MTITTLCYIRHEGKVLMMLRTKKDHDPNEGKWIGVGGHLEENESPEDCLLREVREETGLILDSWKSRGIITFVNTEYETERMCLYEADAFHGVLKECDEGFLEWIPEDRIMDLNLWEGDRWFLEKMFREQGDISMKLVYDGDKLLHVIMNGKDIKG